MLRRRTTFWVLALLAAGAVLAAVYFGLRRDVAEPGRPAEMAAQVWREQRDVALAQLENADFATAMKSLESLGEKFPNDPFVPHNTAIALLLAVREKSGPYQEEGERESAVRRGLNLLQSCEGLESEAAVLHRLKARFAVEVGDLDRMREEFSRSTELAPKDAGIRFEWAQRLKATQNETTREQAADLIREAFELEPENLVLLVERLLSQAELKDAGIGATLERARDTLKPFSEGIRLRTGFDLAKSIEDSLTAVSESDWGTVSRNVRVLSNVLRPEAALQIDQRELVPHELEFVLNDFSPKTRSELALSPQSEPATAVRFVTPDAGGAIVPFEAGTPTRRIALCNFDLDGRLDVVALRTKDVTVFGRGRAGEAWSVLASFPLEEPMAFVLAADLDRDYLETPSKAPARDETGLEGSRCLTSDVDLVVGGPSGCLVLRNKFDATAGTRTLERVPQEAAFDAMRNVLAGAMADVDHDGDLDLVFSTKSGISIWANRDDFTFFDISDRSALPAADYGATTIIPVDWNRNVDTDLILASPTGPVGLLENNLHGRFRWKPFDGEAWNELRDAPSAAVLDADGNASWDLVVAGRGGVRLALTRTDVAGVNRLDRVVHISEAGPSSVLPVDYDNDGVLDLVSRGAAGLQVYRGLPSGGFQSSDVITKNSPRPEKGKASSFRVAAGDVDGDGDMDLVAVNESPGSPAVSWLRNEGGNENHWMEISLSAEPSAQRPSERTNMHGVGSLIELKSKGRYQARVVEGQTTHFGLGHATRPDVARILWTNGIPHNLIEPAGNRTICALQHLKGSCPYLYTWTGSKFEFFSDCLWGAPIGLQFAEGVAARPREWEYLLVPGSRLVPVEGEYRLQVTEELWEAAYFDTLQLIAIDHPSNVRIYSNEKVGPPDLAAFKVHTVTSPRVPVSARDQKGRDVLPSIRAEDGEFVRAYDRRLKQGLAEPHFLELDLGQAVAEAAARGAPQVTLFLTGWVFPTDTSLNIGLSQNPAVNPPKPPAIHVPSDSGWKEVLPFVGFPGGKTKTMAVELPSGIFDRGNTRLRVVTSMELAWDHVFFTLNEPAAEWRRQETALVQADLHPRGYSRRVQPTGAGPEWYDYETVLQEPLWPPMGGRFTRYGDVTALVQAKDDLQVVLGSGDELSLRFRMPKDPLPEGWTRDFLLYNVGWDKDADLNTIYGQTVEPLPFAAMPGYPYGAAAEFPSSDRHREWIENFQTRVQNEPAFWRFVLRHRGTQVHD